MRLRDYISFVLLFLILSLPVTFAASLTYDENGNLITGDGLYREYDSFNHLVRVRAGNLATSPLIVNYTWHPTEDRVLIKDVYFNGTINETVYYVSENFVRVVNSSGTFDFTYVYQNGQLVGQLNPDGSKLYMHDDHLGSTSLITNQSGATVEETFYDPFGGIVSGGATSRFDYEAKEYDPVTSDTDFHARKSKPQWAGMFTQPDPVIQNVYDPQSLNHYAFERNSPYRYMDPSGHIFGIDDALEAAAIYYVVVYLVVPAFEAVTEQADITILLAMEGYDKGGVKGAAEAVGLVAAGGVVAKAVGTAAGAIGEAASKLLAGKGDDAIADALEVSETTTANVIKTANGEMKLSDHTITRLEQRGISSDEVINTIDNGESFTYDYYDDLGNYHGVQTGYYNPETETFVAVQNGEVRTVFPRSQRQINNIKNKGYVGNKPPSSSSSSGGRS